MAAAVALVIAFCSLYTVAQAVPFYLYSGPAFIWVRNCSVNHAKELKGLHESLYAGEVLFQERLQHHPEREPVPLSAVYICRGGRDCALTDVLAQACLTRTGKMRSSSWSPSSQSSRTGRRGDLAPAAMACHCGSSSTSRARPCLRAPTSGPRAVGTTLSWQATAA